jgi:O-succinylbenzoate synthase
MSLRAEYFKRTFQFNFRARTSRGVMRDKTSWFIRIHDSARPGISGIGECGPLPGLSIDATPDFEKEVVSAVAKINEGNLRFETLYNLVSAQYPALIFGLETAFLDLENGGRRLIYDNGFAKGEINIPINGLIWMGDMDFMMTQINEKIGKGFKCIKLKVGGLDFDRECDMLEYIRKRYFRDDIMIRLDANGGFKLDDVLFKLTELAKFNVDSIEQPIKPGLPEMEELCRKSAIPVAFDEELIGKTTDIQRTEVLDRLKPRFLILKPTLHGGLAACQRWIELARQRNIGWWVTSALESNVGLNAICQFTSNYAITVPQGLGTGNIYSNNFQSPLIVDAGFISTDMSRSWGDIN